MLPFSGLRVLDLTHVFAGPFAAFQLGVMGAEVIKIEPVDNPDMARSEGPDLKENQQLMGMHFRAQASGKQCLALDLKSQDGQLILEKLVQSADVLVQNYTLNASVRLGLTADRLHSLNPQLIFCSMSGYGYTGPKAQHPSYDLVIQAYTGAVYANSKAGEGPVRIGPAVVDYSTGMQAALAIAGALFRRQQTGKGAVIDVAMADCAMMLMNYQSYYTLQTGSALSSAGNNDARLAGYGAYETQDGLIMLGAFTSKQLSNLMHALGYNKEAQQILITPHTELATQYTHHAKLLIAACMRYTASELERKLNDAHIPAARIRTMDEAVQDEQFQSRPVFQTIEGKLATVAGFSYDDATPTVHTAPRAFGADSEAILRTLGYDTDEIDRLRQNAVIAG